MNSLNYQLFSNRYFFIEQCRDPTIPGYLIVNSIKKVDYIDELDLGVASVLGTTLALAVSVIRRVIRPVRIYSAQFGEETNQLHFHIFPRTEEITEKYLQERPGEKLICGPILFDWARTRFKGTTISEPDADLIERIRRELNQPDSKLMQ